MLSGALILNAGYEPIKIVSWQKAILLLLQDRVDVLEFHTAFIRSPSTTFQLPAVLRLRKYIRPYFRVKDRPSRLQIFRRDQQICQYCQNKFALKDLTLDHIIPISKGGKHTWDNVVTSCSRCNNKKGNKSPEQVGLRLLRKPFKPSFLEDRGLKPYSETVPESWMPYLPAGKTALSG